VTLVVPFPAGGSNDVIARVFAERLAEGLGQPFVVENRPGANGNIGASQVARAAPDGYTLLVSGNGQNAMNHGLYAKMPYDSRKDFVHVTLLASTANALVATPDFPARSFKEFIALAKRGAAPVLTDVLGGHVPVAIMNVDIPLSSVRSGKLRVLAVTSAERSALYPDAPTVAEEGYPGFAASGWIGLSAPAGTPKEITDKLHGAVTRALQDGRVRQRLADGGYVPGGLTPEAYAAFIASEIEKWGRVAKESGASID
jgi:tripartite-type tricarboxylate transporter receptor subunit TctC